MPADKRCTPIKVGPITFPSITAARHHFGIKYRTYRARVSAGWCPTKAVSTSPNLQFRRKDYLDLGQD